MSRSAPLPFFFRTRQRILGGCCIHVQAHKKSMLPLRPPCRFLARGKKAGALVSKPIDIGGVSGHRFWNGFWDRKRPLQRPRQARNAWIPKTNVFDTVRLRRRELRACYLELPPIGWQLFISGSSQSDSTGCPSFLDAYATRLLAESLFSVATRLALRAASHSPSRIFIHRHKME